MLLRSAYVARCSGFGLEHDVVLLAVDDVVVTWRSLIIVWSVEPMLRAVTPRLAARSRVDAHEHLRLRLAQIRIEPHEARVLGRVRDDDVAPARELVVVRAAEHELHGLPAAAATAAAVAAVMNAMTRTSGISSHCLFRTLSSVCVPILRSPHGFSVTFTMPAWLFQPGTLTTPRTIVPSSKYGWQRSLHLLRRALQRPKPCPRAPGCDR